VCILRSSTILLYLCVCGKGPVYRWCLLQRVARRCANPPQPPSLYIYIQLNTWLPEYVYCVVLRLNHPCCIYKKAAAYKTEVFVEFRENRGEELNGRRDYVEYINLTVVEYVWNQSRFIKRIPSRRT